MLPRKSMSDTLTNRSFSALRWGYAGFCLRAAAGFASGIVLARLLGPKPFGEVAVASLILGFANQLADGGFSSALVQAPELADTDVRFVFTAQLAIGSALTICGICAAPLVAALFHDPIITNVLRASSFLFLIQAFGQTSSAVLKRRLEFRGLQYAQVTSYVFGYGFVGIVAAWFGGGVWSLIAAQLVQSATYSAFVYLQLRHSVLPSFSKRGLHLGRFGVKTTCANLLNWSITNGDNACVGFALGSATLGLYSRAFDTVNSPASSVVNTWQLVLFAGCSRAGNRGAVRRAYLASLTAVTLILLPTLSAVAICSPTIVATLYGVQWNATAPLLVPLAIAVAVSAALALAGPIPSAVDMVEKEIKAQAISLLLAIVAFLVAARYSAVAVAWSVLAVYIARFVLVTAPTLRVLDLGWNDVLRVTRGALALACATSFMAWGTDQFALRLGIPAVVRTIMIVPACLAATWVLLLLVADCLLSSELVTVLNQGASRLPRWISKRVKEIEARRVFKRVINEQPVLTI